MYAPEVQKRVREKRTKKEKNKGRIRRWCDDD